MYKDLSLKEKSELFKLMVSNGITDINEIEKIYNSYSDGGYLSYMEKLAKKKAKDWGMEEDEALTMMLNNNEYDYKAFYNNNREDALKMLNSDSNTHFSDIGKTVWHPTFSNESIYSGKVSEYNPKGTIGGSWKGLEYVPSKSQLDNKDFNYNRTKKYLDNTPEYISDTYNKYQYGGIVNKFSGVSNETKQEKEIIYPDIVSKNRELWNKEMERRKNRGEDARKKQQKRKSYAEEAHKIMGILNSFAERDLQLKNSIQKSIKDAINEQQEQQREKHYNNKLFLNSLATAAELGSAAWMLGKGAKALGILPNRVASSGLYSSDTPQIVSGIAGTLADS